MGKLKKYDDFINESVPTDEEIDKHIKFADGGDEDAYNQLKDIADVDPQDMDEVRRINKVNQGINNVKVLYEGAVKNLLYEMQEVIKELMDETIDTYLASENNVKNDSTGEEVPVEYNIDEISSKYANKLFELVSGSIKESNEDEHDQLSSSEYNDRYANALDEAKLQLWDVMKKELLELIEEGKIEDNYQAEEYVTRECDISHNVWRDNEIENAFKRKEGLLDDDEQIEESINESVTFEDGVITFDDDDIMFFESRGFDHYGRTPEHPDFLKEEGELVIDPNSKLLKQIKESLGKDSTVKEFNRYMKDNLPHLSKWNNDILEIWTLI